MPEGPRIAISGKAFIYVLVGLIVLTIISMIRTGRKQNRRISAAGAATAPPVDSPTPTPAPQKTVYRKQDQAAPTRVEQSGSGRSGAIPRTGSGGGGAPMVIEAGGQRYPLTLDMDPLRLGRAVEDLPSGLTRLLLQDDAISRHHCDVWYKAATDELYVLGRSGNGTLVDNTRLGKDEKGKVRFNKPVTIKLGSVTLKLSRSS